MPWPTGGNLSIRNLDFLFRPRSFALVGASDREHTVGAAVMRNLLTCRSETVNRSAERIRTRRCTISRRRPVAGTLVASRGALRVSL
jgi:hypothetical protein